MIAIVISLAISEESLQFSHNIELKIIDLEKN